MYAKTYVFGNKNQKLNTDSRSKETAVTGGQLYDAGLGYGFVTEADFRSNEMLQMPELSSGFVPAYADTIGEVTRIVTDDLGCHVDGRVCGLSAWNTGEMYDSPVFSGGCGAER